MVSNKQEKAFKDLIQSTGYESSPGSILTSVMDQLEKEKQASQVRDRALIPQWVFVLILIALFTFTGFSLYTIQDFNIPGLSNLFQISWDFNFALNGLPELGIGKTLPIIAVCTLPMILIQFYFIKRYYERSI
ncbi:MAG: hypothetical protein HKN67_00165 [Saprospiraceae bacterium]|nr:hypothetical protein [Saprospiraceae bacterium]